MYPQCNCTTTPVDLPELEACNTVVCEEKISEQCVEFDYYEYKVQLSQTADNNPEIVSKKLAQTGVPLVNTLTEMTTVPTITFGYEDVGVYTITSSEAIFTLGKTELIYNPLITSAVDYTCRMDRISDTVLKVFTFNGSTETDGLLLYNTIGFKIYK